MEDEEIARRRNHEPFFELIGAQFDVYLDELSRNLEEFNVEQLIAALEATTTLTKLSVNFGAYKPTLENNRRILEPLCRCIANLRQHNRNHPLRTLVIRHARGRSHHVEQFLVAAKMFGIPHLNIGGTRLSIQSLVEFCRDNTHLKVFEINVATFSVEKTAITTPPQDRQQNSSAVLVLEKLMLEEVEFKNSAQAAQFSNFIAHLNYPALDLGAIIMGGDEKREDKNSAQMRTVSELIKPSLQRISLSDGCPIAVMDVIEASATVTQIELYFYVSTDFYQPAVQQKMHTITTRNRELARFIADPRDYSVEELLELMTQFDRCPTGRYMLARCFSEIPFFFKMTSPDSFTAGVKRGRNEMR